MRAPSLAARNGLADVARQVRSAIVNRVEKGSEVVDINGWMARTTLEMLGQAALGYSFDNFMDDSTDAFGESLKAFLCVQPAMSWFAR